MTQTYAFASRRDITAMAIKMSVDAILDSAEQRGVDPRAVRLVSVEPDTWEGEPSYSWRFTSEDARSDADHA